MEKIYMDVGPPGIGKTDKMIFVDDVIWGNPNVLKALETLSRKPDRKSLEERIRRSPNSRFLWR